MRTLKEHITVIKSVYRKRLDEAIINATKTHEWLNGHMVEQNKYGLCCTFYGVKCLIKFLSYENGRIQLMPFDPEKSIYPKQDGKKVFYGMSREICLGKGNVYNSKKK